MVANTYVFAFKPRSENLCLLFMYNYNYHRVWSCEGLICSINHRNSLGVMIESLAYWPGQVTYGCMMIQSFAWLGPPAQPYEVSLAGVQDGSFLGRIGICLYTGTLLNPKQGGGDL